VALPARSICVIGAQGALGGEVARQFEAAGWTVRPAGRRAGAGGRFQCVDLERPETIGAAIDGVELVVNAVADRGLAVERAVLERGGVLVNCSHAPAHDAGLLNTAVGKPRGAVLLNGGLVPGLANLAAADLLKRHSHADTIEIAFTVLASGTGGKAGAEFVHRGLVSRRHHKTLTLPLPAPFGRLAFLEVGEDADHGFAGVAGGRAVETFLGFGDRSLRLALRAINSLRLCSLLPRSAFTFAAGRGEGDASSEPTVVWVGVRRGKQRLGAMTLACEGDYRTTAALAGLFGTALLDGSPAPGCFNPEDLFTLTDLAPSLSGIDLRIQTTEPIE
jgi:hypothetical protein